MKFGWTQQSINWFIAASSYTQFHKKLAGYLLPQFNNTTTVQDFGCGLGRLDLALAPYVKSIVGYDISQPAIDCFNDAVKEEQLQNVTPLCEDAEQTTAQTQVGIMSFFGKSKKDMGFYRNRCTQKLIRISNLQNSSTLYPPAYRNIVKDTVQTVEEELKAHGFQFSHQVVELEFGQPLRSWQDAEAFIKLHAPDCTQADAKAFLEQHIQSINNVEYPLYLPNQKSIGIFTIDATK